MTNMILPAAQHFDENLDSDFEKVFAVLKSNLDCSYMFYMYEETTISKRISYSTNKEWQQHYAYDGLINYCPLLHFTRKQLLNSKTKSVMVPWNFVTPNNRLQRNVVGAREDFNIANGVAFSKEFTGAREMWGIASDKKYYDFHVVVHLNMHIINMCRMRLRQIAMNELVRQNYILVPENQEMIKRELELVNQNYQTHVDQLFDHQNEDKEGPKPSTQ